MSDMNRVVLLLSGGLDSTVLLADLIDKRCNVAALTVNYGQKHESEIAAAGMIAANYGVEWRVVSCSWPADGLLLSASGVSSEDATGDLSPFYLPARNLVFLSLAAAWAEQRHARQVAIGSTADDYAGFPDCRPEFFTAFEKVTRAGMAHQISVVRPFASLRKVDVVRIGRGLGVRLDITVSCYRGLVGDGCGNCEACQRRSAAMKEAG